MSDPLAEWTQQVVMNGLIVTEEHLRVLVQPRPRWLPERVWRRILTRLLVVEHGPITTGPRHRPDQACDCINPATGRHHRALPGDPAYHCAAAWEIANP